MAADGGRAAVTSRVSLALCEGAAVVEGPNEAGAETRRLKLEPDANHSSPRETGVGLRPSVVKT